MDFFLGTHRPNWLALLDVPMFVSHRTLRGHKRLPVARGPWALDSGAFTEIKDNGRWTFGVEEYVEAVQRYGEEIGHLQWAAPMDWPSEPFAREKTGLTVREHQERTVQNYLDLRGRGPFVPVLQGWEFDDYHACADLYAEADVDLTAESLVAVGSVCRRHATAEIASIMRSLAARGLRLHGFGVKQGGIERYADALVSADSMAWSFRARHDAPLPGCAHKSCANCPRYALRWYEQIVGRVSYVDLVRGAGQATLFEDVA